MSREEFEIVLDGLIQLGIFKRDKGGRVGITAGFARELMAKVDEVLARRSLIEALRRHEVGDKEIIILIVAEAVKERVRTIDVETLAKYVNVITAYFHAAVPEKFKAMFG
jgi:hypothetical protein